MKITCRRGHIYHITANDVRKSGIKDEHGRYVGACDECEIEDELESEMEM